jgi:hypothetical protein
MQYLDYMAQFTNLLPLIFLSLLAVILIITIVLYFIKRGSMGKHFDKLIAGVVSVRIFYAVILTLLQYQSWAKDGFTHLLLQSPIDKAVPLPAIIEKFSWLRESKLGYFIFYSWGRFWISVLLAILAAMAFWWFLKLLKKYSDRFFEDGEVELGFLAALIVGWPDFVIFIPTVFISVVLVSIVRRIFKGEMYTTLGIPFLLAALIVMIFGDKLINLLNLGVLRI